MTHKAFYQAAADEVAEGRVDKALWIKVCADCPGDESKMQQAKYIALRAREMAQESGLSHAQDVLKHVAIHWVLFLAVVFTVAILVGKAVDLSLNRSSPLPFIVFLTISIVLIGGREIIKRSTKGE